MEFSLSNSCTMRYVGPEQAEVLAALHAECFPHYWDRQAFNDFFSVAGTQALVLETNDDTPECIAMLVYRVQFEQADIITLAVKNPYRRKGIARALLQRSMDDILKKGVDTLFLDVEEGNEAAILLYEGLDFTRQRRRRQYYKQKDGSYTDALVMTKKFA